MHHSSIWVAIRYYISGVVLVDSIDFETTVVRGQHTICDCLVTFSWKSLWFTVWETASTKQSSMSLASWMTCCNDCGCNARTSLYISLCKPNSKQLWIKDGGILEI